MRTIGDELRPRDKQDKHPFGRDHSLVPRCWMLQQVDTICTYYVLRSAGVQRRIDDRLCT